MFDVVVWSSFFFNRLKNVESRRNYRAWRPGGTIQGHERAGHVMLERRYHAKWGITIRDVKKKKKALPRQPGVKSCLRGPLMLSNADD